MAFQGEKKPTSQILQKKWKDRQNRRRIPLLAICIYQDKAYVCGPNGEKPPIYSDLDIKQIEIAKLIKFLLKDQGLTISGVKKVLKSKINNLDDYYSFSLKTKYQKQNIKNKTNKILEKIRSLKNYGKKNSY